ncbi:MAG: PD-(D/E)XK nuclease family protein [Thiotrichales bacterium]|nr:PD-(D/E)XK nuclease family protein [Thiotrichales bacterium]
MSCKVHDYREILPIVQYWLPFVTLISLESYKAQLRAHLQQAPIAQAVGHLVHKVLELWARQGIEQIPLDSIEERADFYQRWLGQQGLDTRQVQLAWPRAQRCLQQAWHQPKIRWALSAQQVDARNEYVLQSQNAQGEVALHIVDRTFVDAQGVRWIIDYKTSTPPDATDAQTRADFLAEQCTRYRPQLQRYAELFQAQETRPQKQVLYFAQLDEWIELNALSNAQP